LIGDENGKIVVIVIAVTILLCACHNHNNQESVETTEFFCGVETEEVKETIIPSLCSENAQTETSILIQEYEVSPYSIDYSFDCLATKCIELAGIENYNLGDIYNEDSDYQPIYYPDYSEVLEEMTFESVDYSPNEFEKHINRSFFIYGLWVYINEYDNPEWTEDAFRYWADYYMSNGNDALVDHCDEGYYFICEDDMFSAVYFLNDCFFSYNYYFNNGNTEQYQIYLDICEELGLPTCDEVTEEIMGDSN